MRGSQSLPGLFQALIPVSFPQNILIASYICKLRGHINQNQFYYLKNSFHQGYLDGGPQMAEQYLHAGQEGESQTVPGLSGPATVEDRTLEEGYPWTCGLGPRRKKFYPRPRVDPIMWG